jgi:hypothetical protein
MPARWIMKSCRHAKSWMHAGFHACLMANKNMKVCKPASMYACRMLFLDMAAKSHPPFGAVEWYKRPSLP